MRAMAGDREIQFYLLALVFLAGASVALMYALLATGYHSFLDTLFEEPSVAVGNNPMVLVFGAAIVVLVLLLVALVVLFGAKYALDPTEDER